MSILRSIRGLQRTIFLIMFMTGLTAAYAQGDSAAYTHRQFDQQTLQKYREQRDFKYESTAPAGEVSIWDWLWDRFLRLLTAVFGERQQVTVGRIIMYCLMIFAIVMIILNLTGIEIRKFLVRDAQSIISPQIGEENIREMNMDELIADAAAKKQWRLSVRYQYLKALRMLTDRELIKWRIGKTNMDYYYEIKADALKERFLKATDDFENVWYGNGEVTEAHYLESKRSLEDFYAQIQTHTA